MVLLEFSHIPKAGGSFLREVLDTNDVDYVYHGHKSFLGKENPDAVSFSVVRNPFELLVSMYYHGDGGYADYPARFNLPNFDSFVRWFCINNPNGGFGDPFFFGQILFRGCCTVDVVYKFEEQDATLADLSRRIGKKLVIPENVYKNTSRRRPKGGLDTFYTPELRRLVEERYKDDLAMFGYTFDGPVGPAVLAANGP